MFKIRNMRISIQKYKNRSRRSNWRPAEVFKPIRSFLSKVWSFSFIASMIWRQRWCQYFLKTSLHAFRVQCFSAKKWGCRFCVIIFHQRTVTPLVFPVSRISIGYAIRILMAMNPISPREMIENLFWCWRTKIGSKGIDCKLKMVTLVAMH